MPDETTDPYNLARFLAAQRRQFETACGELRGGRKRSHWMWFVFPQIQGLGYSEMARHYAISGLPEARAYLDHEVLGPRLRLVTDLVNAIERRPIREIFGDPDDLKFHSSVTLFARATPENEVFEKALRKYFGGKPDQATVKILYTISGVS